MRSSSSRGRGSNSIQRRAGESIKHSEHYTSPEDDDHHHKHFTTTKGRFLIENDYDDDDDDSFGDDEYTTGGGGGGGGKSRAPGIARKSQPASQRAHTILGASHR